MNTLDDVITYCRRIIKAPSNASIFDALIVDYINRFWLMDVDASMQLFDFKTKYTFETIPGIADYNMPLYQTQSSALQQTITPFPVYQGFMSLCYVNGIAVPLYTQRSQFYSAWPNYIQPLNQVATGDGATTTFQFNLPYFPAIPGHLDITGIIATGSSQDPIFTTTLQNAPPTSVYPGVFITYTNQNGSITTVVDSGQFLQGSTDGDLRGLLMIQGAPGGTNTALGPYSVTQNTVNYATGLVNVTFPTPPPANQPIRAQCYIFIQGLPVGVLYFNNTLTFRPPPNTQYLVEIDAYLTPAAFLSSSESLPFAYMAEYIALGASRKILSDTGDIEQLNTYEERFKEQRHFVWTRSARIKAETRTPTIYSGTSGIMNNYGQWGSY